MKKYELIGNFEFYGKKFYQVKALISFGSVRAGDLGGYIEKENNLSQEGDAWVYDNAIVYGNAIVSDNARIFDSARIFDNALVLDNARVSGKAWVSDDAIVSDDTWISDNARISGKARIYDKAWVFGNAWISDNAGVSGNACVSGNANIFGNAKVSDNARISNNAMIINDTDLFLIPKIGSQLDTLTVFKTKNGFKLTTGCFMVTFEEFKEAISGKPIDDLYRKEYEALYPFIEFKTRGWMK